MPYVDFCSQLISKHEQRAANEDQQKPLNILPVDIMADKGAFILQMASVVTHLIIESTCLKHQQFLAPTDPEAQQDGINLREIVYLTMTTKEIVRRLVEEDTDPT